jgi:pyruvate kinase
MDKVAQSAEGDTYYNGILHAQRNDTESTSADAISAAARTIAETLNVPAIVCYTGSGSTGARLARQRPSMPILALTPIIETARRLTLTWGTHAVLVPDAKTLDDMMSQAGEIAFREEFAKSGERIIITAGVPIGAPGTTNMLRIATIGPGGKGV